MATVPSELKYTEEHEWARPEDDLYVIGITDYAQDTLGDVVYVELGEVGDTLERGQPFGVVESVKAASDLYAPLSGEIVAVNSALFDTPETLNSDPYDAGWMIKVRPSKPDEVDSLLNAAAYEALLS